MHDPFCHKAWSVLSLTWSVLSCGGPICPWSVLSMVRYVPNSVSAVILIKQAAISLSDLFVDYFGPNHFTIVLNQFHLIIFLSVEIIVQQSNLYQSLAREP